VPAGSGGFVGGLSIVVLAIVPFLVHHMISGAASPGLVVSLAATQATAMILFCTRRLATWVRAAIVGAALLLAAAAMIAFGLPAASVGRVVTGGCHAAAYLSLLIWFATSLRPKREPVVTALARRVRRTMPDKVVRYTRQVTIAWCVFFAAQLVVSLLLLLLAPENVWSAFVNVLNLPLVTTMVLAEFGCRLILFRHEPRTGLIETLSAMRRAHAMPANRP
jgi:uncharacterized membrane protein